MISLKKIFTLALTMFLMLTLSSCGDYYKELNNKISKIQFEEEGYVFFTNQFKIDGKTTIELEDVIKGVFDDNKTTYEFIYYSYELINDLLHFQVNFKRDRKDYLTKAIVVLDAEALNELLFETVYEGEKGAYFDSADNNDVIMKDNNKNIINKYKYADGSYTKEEYIIGEIDYERYERPPLQLIKNDIKYKIEQNSEGLKIVTDVEDLNYQTDLFSLFKESKVGKEIYDYSVELNKELSLDMYELFIYNNELFITYQFKAGFLMNKSLLGKTEELIFRFDFYSRSLKYIGKTKCYVNGVYF